MDTTAIFNYLHESEHENNTVLVLSNTLYENVKYVCSELSGVQVMYEPLSINHPEFLELLANLGITIKCSNQELLNNLPTKQNVLIGSGNLSPNFIKSALAQGYQQFLVLHQSDIARVNAAATSPEHLQLALVVEESEDLENMITECRVTAPISVFFGKELKTVADVQNIGSKIHNVLELAKFHGKDIREIFIGMVDNVGDIGRLKAPILALKESVPHDLTLTIELGQHVVETAAIVATKITGKTSLGGRTEYEVDMSMFCELASYMDIPTQDNTFDIKTEAHSGVLNPARVIGNTGDTDDVIFSGSLPEDLTEDGWILIVNAGMADCRDFDIVLFDKNFSTLRAVKPMLSQHEVAALESLDLIGSAIRVTA